MTHRATNGPLATAAEGSWRSLTGNDALRAALHSTRAVLAAASPIFQAGHEGSIPFARSNPKPQVRALAGRPIAWPVGLRPGRQHRLHVHADQQFSRHRIRSRFRLNLTG